MLDFYRGRGNRLCGGDQRAMQTGEACDRPLETFGSHPCLLSFIGSFLVSVPFVSCNKHYPTVAWETEGEGVKGATADFVCFYCPLVAPAGAKSLHKHAETA